MTLSVKHITTAGIVLALFIALALGWTVKFATDDALDSAQWVAHTMEVERGLENIESELRTAQAMVRGHVLFGDGETLALYRSSIGAFDRQVAVLRELTFDNPAQQRALDGLALTAADYFRHLDRIVELRRRAGPEAARGAFVGGAGHPLLLEVISQIEAMAATEARLLAERRANLALDAARTRSTIYAAGALMFAILAASIVALRRDNRRRLLAERRVQEVNENLERLVQERTASVRNWETIFRHAGWGVVVVDAQSGRIVADNPALSALLRASRPAIGRPLAELFAPEERAALAERARQAETLGNLHYESVWLRDDGTRFPVEVQVTGFRDDAGRLFRAANVQDISERKQAEGALREAHDVFRELVLLAADYFWELDENFRFRELTAAARIGGRYDWQAYLGKARWEMPYLGMDAAKWAAHRADLEAHRPFRNLEMGLASRQGEERWFLVSGDPVFDKNRGFTGYRGASVDITGRKQAERQLAEYAAQLEVLSRRLLQAQEDERRAIARELHDEIGQTLTAIKLTLSALRRRMADEAAIAMMGDSIGMVDIAIAQVRDRSLDLRPPMLDDIGLAGTLEWLVRRLAEKVSLRITADIAPLAERPAPEVESAAFRIVQEALTNVLRHAGAREAAVRLWQEEGLLCLSVKDDGAGFDPQAREAGFGLAGMRERALLLGGEFMLDSSPEKGAEIRARLPIRPKSQL